MKEELKKKKKLQEFAKAAGAGGIKEAVSDETKKKIISGAKEVGKNVVKTIGSMAAEPVVGKMVEGLLKKKKTNEIKKGAIKATGNTTITNTAKEDNSRDAQLERQTAKRYEKVGVSPIYSKGNFSRNSKQFDEKYGNRLTEDDKVPASRKKRK